MNKMEQGGIQLSIRLFLYSFVIPNSLYHVENNSCYFSLLEELFYFIILKLHTSTTNIVVYVIRIILENYKTFSITYNVLLHHLELVA